MFKCSYLNQVYNKVKNQFTDQVEYLQAIQELFKAIEPLVEERADQLQKNAIIERLIHPERIISFRIPWQDDTGQVHVNWGCRVQHSSLLGPYKGGLRFDPTVNESILKFLALEQTFKNALTGLLLGGGKGGADFDPRGKSDSEIMRFCQSFMTELSKYISQDQDVPAGDIGVGKKEIGYLYGQYKRLKGIELGVLTGKPILANGSKGREEATGHGLIYFTQALLKEEGLTLNNMRVIISGTGNVGQHAITKAIEAGARVVAISNIYGSLYDPQGIDLKVFNKLSLDRNIDLSTYCKLRPQSSFEEKSVWDRSIPADLALPCATQNEISTDQAKNLIQNGVRFLVEGANMPSTSEAIQVFQDQPDFIWAPGKAANAGGVAVSGFEMSQNAGRLPWTAQEVDRKLQEMMQSIFQTCQQTCLEYQLGKNYAAAADIVAFNQLIALIEMQGLI